MNNQESRSEVKIKAIIALFSIIALGLCAWFFSIGYFAIVQNLLYLPIIVACAYFTKRGLVFSTVIALVYLILLVMFSNNHTVILGGAVRSIVFVVVGAVVAFITIKKQSAEKELFSYKGHLESLVAEKTTSLEQLVHEKTTVINELKQMEKELLETKQRLLMANKATNDVIWDWDVRSDMQQWNETGTAVFGWTEIVERPVNAHWWVERVHPDDRERVHDSFFAVVNNPELDVWRDEYHFLKTDGTYADVLDRGYVLRDEKGKAIRMVGAMQDITAHKKAEKALLQAKKAESLEHMAGAVAHHYNNLMGIVLGNLELTELPGFAPEQVASLLIEARRAASRAADLSNLMLAYLGLSTGKRKSLDLGAVCREVLADILPRLPQKTRLELSGLPDGLIVRADSAQMRQLLDALVTNAVESFEDEEGVITVMVTEAPAADLPVAGVKPVDWRPEGGRRCACLEVADTGPGMTPETLEKVFDPFFSTRFTGRGLGLPVVLGIVKAHEGGIILESRPGSGTIVRILLPLSEEKPAVRPSSSSPSAPFPKQGLVLVVDDEPALRKMAQLMLTSLGFETVSAPNGAEALELFRRRPQEFLCVLCDLTMPGMSGWETLAVLRSIRADIPVILCSGHNEAAVMAYVQTDMPQVFLGKPYDKAKLTAALAAVCSTITPVMKPPGESG